MGGTLAVLMGAFLFNLGQGVLRPTLPLYLQQKFAASYWMVTSIPTVFGAGKWVASLPTGYLADRVGRRPLLAAGLSLLALCDVASVLTADYRVFLGLRGLAGAGWAMFATVATTVMVGSPSRRGRAVSTLMMSETSGLLLGSATGGWLYGRLGGTSPFLFEAGCMLVAAVVVLRWVVPAPAVPVAWGGNGGHAALATVLRTPGVWLMGLTSAALTAIHAGVLVFLFPLYLANRARLGPERVGLLVSVTVLGRLLALWLGGGASDRCGRLRILGPGLAVYAGLLASLPALTRLPTLALWSLAAGAAAGLVAALPTALVGDRVPPALHGVAIGWLRTMTDTGQILGPLALGALADGVDLAAPFVAGAALLAGAAWAAWRQEAARRGAESGAR
jgi:DHA1 family multidrug resistance protein-like MFS transporter